MIPVIISGGSGTRLWPISRKSFPKQFVQIFERSLFEETIDRLMPLGAPWVVTTKDMKVLTEKTMKDRKVPTSHLVLEPMGRNTAPAVALICRIFEIKGWQDQVMGIFPADHLIEDEAEFTRALNTAEQAALKGYVTTIGIKPTYPATGYGYIEMDPNTPVIESGSLKAYAAKGFKEKPDLKTAKDYCQSNAYSWNAGMFIFQTKVMIKAFQTHLPDVWETISELKADLSNLEDVYGSLPSVSIDYGIMEKLDRQACVPCSIGWNDLGSWDAIADVAGSQIEIQREKLAFADCDESSNFVFPANRDKVYGVIGLNDLLVVDSPDALLIAKKGYSEKAREIVSKLHEAKQPAAEEHLFEVRPWGKYEILRDTDQFKSKVITVDPHSQLSYQSHTKREEFWVVVSGMGEVILNDETIPVQRGKVVHIPLGAKHRMRNTGATPLDFVEVQVGSYFGEDDIVRYEDDYQRC
ncbi:MAG: mannose-1-phosphate guanylyltransferase/mannose-6-phosphate isomerase [Bdellovibrionaceae bacterium]|nr:mannose-1-phosphate guanylyltransferase/mannose-6-phosphate isomerase [Pseudobdellovibrionaceae bacterium]